MTTADLPPIDADDEETWPDASQRWATQRAEALAGSTKFVRDLDIGPHQEDEFRQTFGPRRVLAFHCTRLLPHESEAIRTDGLRPLSETLLLDRIAAAVAHGALPPETRQLAEHGNVFATGDAGARPGKTWFLVGRAVFDLEAHGCDPLLRHWGGEAIRGGPSDAAHFAEVGKPSIVVASLDLTRPHDDPYSSPALAKVFVGAVLGLEQSYAELPYGDPGCGRHISAIWQPGDLEYDRHPDLPR